MEQFTVVAASVKLHAGIMILNAAQAAARAHCLEHLSDDRYGIKDTVQFKRGETFGYDGTLPKMLAEAMLPPRQAAAVAVKNGRAAIKAEKDKQRKAALSAANSAVKRCTQALAEAKAAARKNKVTKKAAQLHKAVERAQEALDAATAARKALD